ncbi:glycosyltransferase [Cryptococcus wingfieldii CBS 7118]|uniref:Glycosyltransferase n=1 Tax=Cryptococcus wingfieldii CBS 7118 TaxID=1295528 RepID=A0A1E3J0B5_9TREE|nr:glycosyltransferase [Cryptococcus wingfieldii CBS 7118]ODN94317.1 glycosyltransferase [Cryptococcus wingfieldii CBS 7118]
MLALLSWRYGRFLPLAVLIFLGSIFVLIDSSASSESTLPRASIYDYTSPATHCFWPADNSSRAGAASAQLKGAAGKGTVGKVKQWMGWQDGDEVDEDVAEMEDTPEGHGFAWDGQLPDVVPVSGIERYMIAHIEELQSGYDAEHDFKEYGLKPGNISLSAYTSELLQTYREFLVPPGTPPPVPPPAFLPAALSRLSLRPPIAPLPPRPNHVMTTEKSVDDLPWQFKRWKEIMPDWEIKYFDDKALKDWVNGMFGNTKASKIWETLPRQVLKTDVFRYMAMLVEGGIYTDSDSMSILLMSTSQILTSLLAAPIIHADQWGHPYNHKTSPLLTHLARILSISTSPHLPSSHPLSSFSPEHASDNVDEELGANLPSGKSAIYDGPLVDDGAELGPPSLVVSVESDAVEFGWKNWREVGLSRAVQITQWTFMARPGHPVFLDALGRTLRKSEEMAAKVAEAKKTGEEFIPETALEWTGPGVFSDCVYRYLISRYGFKPDDLIHTKDPIRVGDVLILPAGSYSSVSPFGDEKQRNWAASWHGFFGRWRGADPAVQEFERLKKLKKEAEEAEKKAKEEVAEAEKKAQEATDRAKAVEAEEQTVKEVASEGDGQEDQESSEMKKEEEMLAKETSRSVRDD